VHGLVGLMNLFAPPAKNCFTDIVRLTFPDHVPFHLINYETECCAVHASGSANVKMSTLSLKHLQ